MPKDAPILTEISQLQLLDELEAATYCRMSRPTFRKFRKNRNLNCILKDPDNPRSHRLYQRHVLDSALNSDNSAAMSSLDERAAIRVHQITGESK